MTDKCSMDGCDRDVQNLKRGLCNRCASFARYWRNKPVSRMRHRLGTIDFWKERMTGVLTTHDRKAKSVKKKKASKS